MKVFLTRTAYYTQAALITLFVMGYYFPLLFAIAQVALFLYLAIAATELVLLFANRQGISAIRQLDDRMSNGDLNQITIHLQNHYGFATKVQVLDELPYQLQIREQQHMVKMPPGGNHDLHYSVSPKERGAYFFGHINLLVSTSIGLVLRRIKSGATQKVKVYPSYLKLRQYELAAVSNQLTEVGQKRVRKIGNSLEFDTIRSYVFGDDPRHINWKATAKRNALQVNHYVDEKSQNIYCLIDKGRAMKMPFGGMTLLDYAINASLVLSYIALSKGDRAGLLTFEDQPSNLVKASSNSNQINYIIEKLYAEHTSFNEVDFGALHAYAQRHLTERSLLLLFTNFESLGSLQRQLPYLRLLGRKHLVLVIFFRNTEVDKIIRQDGQRTEQIYQEAVALKQLNEKHLIEDTLRRYGFLSLYTRPEDLNTGVINKYIQIKSRRML